MDIVEQWRQAKSNLREIIDEIANIDSDNPEYSDLEDIEQLAEKLCNTVSTMMEIRDEVDNLLREFGRN